MENPFKMDDLGVPLCFGNTHVIILCFHVEFFSSVLPVGSLPPGVGLGLLLCPFLIE